MSDNREQASDQLAACALGHSWTRVLGLWLGRLLGTCRCSGVGCQRFKEFSSNSEATASQPRSPVSGDRLGIRIL